MNGKKILLTGALLCLKLLVTHAAAAEGQGEVVELWPGPVPDEVRNMGAKKILMSPALDRKQVEVTESTRMVTNASTWTQSCAVWLRQQGWLTREEGDRP